MTTSTTTKRYFDLNEVMDAIRDTLGEFADEYDVDGIAREMTDWEDGKLVADLDRDDFWHIAAQYAC